MNIPLLRPFPIAVLALVAALSLVASRSVASRQALAAASMAETGAPAGQEPGDDGTGGGDAGSVTGDKPAPEPAPPGKDPDRGSGKHPGQRLEKESAGGDAKDAIRHGARLRAADGTLVVYDRVLGVYRVPRRSTAYWIDERFYEFTDGLWKSSASLEGPWALVRQRDVPEPAASRHKAPRGALTSTLPSGREAVFVPRLKAYRVSGLDGLFLVDATFYRYDRGVWMSAASEDGPFRPTAIGPVPVPLRRSVPRPDNGARVELPGGTMVVFEEGTGLFAVEGRKDAVLHDGRFYERRGSSWFASDRVADGWEELGTGDVPPAVRSNYHRSGKDRRPRRQRSRDEAAGSG